LKIVWHGTRLSEFSVTFQPNEVAMLSRVRNGGICKSTTTVWGR